MENRSPRLVHRNAVWEQSVLDGKMPRYNATSGLRSSMRTARPEPPVAFQNFDLLICAATDMMVPVFFISLPEHGYESNKV